METKEMEYQECRADNLEWLEDHCLTESDVMADATGAYVYLDEEDGLRKVYLPFSTIIDFNF